MLYLSAFAAIFTMVALYVLVAREFDRRLAWFAVMLATLASMLLVIILLTFTHVRGYI
jgi:uncharacterized membrane protein